jgi:hypothetical protein
MINKILWFLIIVFYIYCFSIGNEKFENHDKIKNDIIYGLKTIDELFNENNIYYTAAYGTLLGAVRHWDMIPWDDDADLNVWRKDYNKIMGLKEEFKKKGLILEEDWKLIKIYFNDSKYPFIDLFINDIENGRIVRCHEPFEKSCAQLNKINSWWWKWVNYPADWINKRKRLQFGPIKIWCPIESEKILKYWYGEDCLTECKTPEYDHITSNYVEQNIINCGSLPKLQI